MKTYFRSSFGVQAGTITRSEARHAARLAKQARGIRRDTRSNGPAGLLSDRQSGAWERFLGHFGPSTKTKGAVVKTKPATKKRAVRKKSGFSARKKPSTARKKARA